MNEKQAVDVIIELANLNKDIDNNPKFPFFSTSICKDPYHLLQALDRFRNNTTEDENEMFTPHFVGIIEANINTKFVEGLVRLGKMHQYYQGWMNQKYTPNSRVNVTVLCTEADETKPIPFPEQISFRIIYAMTATLKTKPQLIKSFADLSGFDMINNLVNEKPELSDTLQKMYLEFIGYFVSDKACMKAMNKANVLNVLLFLCNSKHKQIRDMSLFTLENFNDNTTTKMLKKAINTNSESQTSSTSTATSSPANSTNNASMKNKNSSSSVEKTKFVNIIDSLFTVESEGTARTKIMDLLNQTLLATEDAKEVLFEHRNISRLIDLFLELTNNDLIQEINSYVNDVSIPATELKRMNNCPPSIWTTSNLMTLIGTGAGGSVERQDYFAKHFSAIVIPRVIHILRLFEDQKSFFLTESVAVFLYKISARSIESQRIVQNCSAFMLLYKFSINMFNCIFNPKPSFRAIRTSSNNKSKASSTTATASGATQAYQHGESIIGTRIAVSLMNLVTIVNAINSTTPAYSLTDDEEEITLQAFKYSLFILSSPNVEKLDFHNAVSVLSFINCIVCFSISDELKQLKRFLKYVKVESELDDVSYLVKYSDIASQNDMVPFSFNQSKEMMDSIEKLVQAHLYQLKFFIDTKWKVLKPSLSNQEKETLFWVEAKTGTGNMLSMLMRQMNMEDDRSSTRRSASLGTNFSNLGSLKGGKPTVTVTGT